MSTFYNDLGIQNDINLTISSFAYEIIIEDIKNFIYKVDKANFSKFCSRIFLNYYKDANANFENRINKEIRNVKKYINEFKINDNREDIINFLSNYLDNKFRLELKDKKDKKDKSKKIYLDDEVISILCGDYEEIIKYYPSHITYFSAILEEYAHLPFFKRERIYYKDIIDTLNKVNNTYNVDLILFNKDSNLKFKDNKVYFKPYKVITDKVDTFNYVVGYSKNASSTSLKRYEIRSFRLSRIKEVRVSESKFKFDKEEIKKLKDELSRKDVRFLSGNEIEFKVRFTNVGITLLNQILYMKPSLYKKDDTDKNVYYFYCSERQLEIYLKEFGAEAKVISPISLKNKLKDYYIKASKTYGEE